MRILIDIGHPAHVHLFKNLVYRLKENNHEVIITVREIPGAIELQGAVSRWRNLSGTD